MTSIAIGQPTSSKPADSFREIATGRLLVDTCVDSTFVELDCEALDASIKNQMYNHLAFCLTWDGHPQSKGRSKDCGDTTIRACATLNSSGNDLVEYRWVFLGHELRATSSINAIRIDIGMSEFGDNADKDDAYSSEAIVAFVSRLIRLNGTNHYGEEFSLDIPWPHDLRDGQSFSTNPDKSILHLQRWHDRVDVFVDGKTLSIIIYKKIPQMMQIQDGSKWFDDEFRALVHAKAKSEE
jgi:hypothetical protein